MAKIDDPQGFEREFERELERLRESDAVDDESEEAIEDFATAHYDGAVADDEQLAVGTLSSYVDDLRFCAEAIGPPLTADPLDELEEYLDTVAKKHSASTHNNRICALKAFGRFHELGWENEDDDSDVFEFIARDTPDVDPEKVFTDDEINAMLEAAGARGRVMIAVLADLGCRIGALCSFRIGDLDLEGAIPKIAFNTDANTKGAEGRVLLTWSAGHIQHYLDAEHPRPDDPDAPLLHLKQDYGPEDDDGAVHTRTATGDLRKIGKEAGIRRERLKPHNFRHTAVTNWIRQGYSTQQIVNRASWASPDMLKVYSNVTDEMAIEDLAVEYELVDDDEVATDPSDVMVDCPQCGTPVRRAASFCGCCHLDVDEFEEVREEQPEGVTLDGTPATEAPEVSADGAGDILEDVPTEVLMQKLVEKSDVDVSDLVDE